MGPDRDDKCKCTRGKNNLNNRLAQVKYYRRGGRSPALPQKIAPEAKHNIPNYKIFIQPVEQEGNI